MNYYLNLFTPETWDAFRTHGATISGFRKHQRKTAERIKPGDKFLCYLVRLSRWCGVLEITSSVFIDSTPIFADPDPFVLRFRVAPKVALDLDRSVPILEPEVWSKLAMTQGIERGSVGWAQHANLRASLRQMNEVDGRFITELLLQQSSAQKLFPLSDQDKARIGQKASIRTVDREVIVEVPDKEPSLFTAPQESPEEVRESVKVQATLASIGAQMGFRVWVPRSDKQRVLAETATDWHSAFLDNLPLVSHEATLRTVEQIDVIWLKGRSMARAFEIEHSTAVYSGLLRMADLLALQPNMDIRLHIVAPSDKREKVFRELKRPVFSLLERGPLYESCSYLPYDAIRDLAHMKFLDHMSDSIIEEYEEFAQDE